MSTLSYHFPEFATSAVTVPSDRGIVCPAVEFSARSRRISSHRGRSLPPPVRTISDWRNVYPRPRQAFGHERNVKRWRGGTMVLRWVAAGVPEAAKGFRRVKGCQDMPALVSRPPRT